MHWGSNVNNDNKTIKTETHALDPHHGNLCNELQEEKEEEILADKEEVVMRQHRDHHPAVKIHWPSLECACGGGWGVSRPEGRVGGRQLATIRMLQASHPTGSSAPRRKRRRRRSGGGELAEQETKEVGFCQ